MSKYGSKEVTYFGITFQSEAEGSYYLYLRSMQDAGEISNLRCQVPYELIPVAYREVIVEKKLKTKTKTEVKRYKQAPTYYYADFVYTTKSGKEIVVDVKSPITRKKESYRLKKKMMLAFKGIDIVEVVFFGGKRSPENWDIKK